MTILDSYAVLAFLKDEAAASEVETLIDAGGTTTTTLGVAEVLDHLIRIVGANEEDASLDVAQLSLDRPVAVDQAVAESAGRLRAQWYHRMHCPVSLADCVAVEVARAMTRPLATSDPALLDVCQAEDVAVIALPGSDGSRWAPARN